MTRPKRNHKASSVVLQPRAQRRTFLLYGLVFTDITATLLAGLSATLIRFGSQHQPVALAGIGAQTDYLVLAAALALAMPLFLWFEELYDIDALFWGSGEFSRALHAATIAVVTLIISSYLLNLDNISRLWLGLEWVLVGLFLVVGRLGFRLVLRQARSKRRLMQPTIVVGCNREAERIASSLQSGCSSGLAVVGCVTANGQYDALGDELIPGVPILGDVFGLPERLERAGADAVVIISSAFEHSEFSEIVSGLRRLHVDVHVSSGLSEVRTQRVLVREVAGTPIMLIRSTAASKYNSQMKRTFDAVFSLLVMFFGLPVWIAIAAAIKLESVGPIFYQQERVGRDGVTFKMFKFRSMYLDADQRLHTLKDSNEADGPLFKMRNDPRITRVGRILRKYSLDEFPQLINVLLGDMSVVGPRPPLPAETQEYTDRHVRRLEVAPGMTGLWQVSGRSDLTFEEMVQLDLFYIENWSLRYDLSLVLRTVPTVMFAKGAY